MEKLDQYHFQEIFGYLDDLSLIAASNVCQSWRHIIYNSQKLMSKPRIATKLQPFEKSIENIKKRLKQIPHKNLIMTSYDLTEKQRPILREFLRSNFKNCYKLKFNLLPFGVIYPSISGSAATLTHLVITRESKLVFERGVLLDFPNLNSLALHNATLFLTLIKSHQLVNLGINEYDGEEYLEPFLQTCNSLKRLEIDNIFPDFDLKAIPFMLKSIKFTSINVKSGMNLAKFLKSQSKSLKFVAILSKHYCNLSLIHFILDHLRLEKLHLTTTVNCEPADYSKGKINHSIKELIFDCFVQCNFKRREFKVTGTAKPYIDIINKCSQLERLDFHDETPHVEEILKNANLDNLKTLYVEYPREITALAGREKLGQVEKLIVGRIVYKFDKSGFFNLISHFPFLKELNVDIWNYESKPDEMLTKLEVQKMFTSLKMLKVFSVENINSEIPTYRFFKNIKKYGSSLCHVDFNIYDDDQIEEAIEIFKDANFTYSVRNSTHSLYYQVDWTRGHLRLINGKLVDIDIQYEDTNNFAHDEYYAKQLSEIYREY